MEGLLDFLSSYPLPEELETLYVGDFNIQRHRDLVLVLTPIT